MKNRGSSEGSLEGGEGAVVDDLLEDGLGLVRGRDGDDAIDEVNDTFTRDQ